MNVALRKAQLRIRWRSSSDRHEDIMLVGNGSPLAFGYGVPDETLHVAPFTENVSYLEDGDWAIITPERVIVRDQSG